MDETLNYTNRDKLYQFLIDEFGFIKIEEKYDPKNFGNFYITLTSKDFLLDYINDRSFLDIYIRSKSHPEESIPLSFVKNYLYQPANLNSFEESGNKTRIERLNNFIMNDYGKICELVNVTNYYDTKTKIDQLLKEQFQNKFPASVTNM